MERLALVHKQIAAIEAERDAIARAGADLSAADTLEGSDEHAAAKIAAVAQLKGIGNNDATLLQHEVFYRDFRNRKELASWAGLAPAPYSSGDIERDQGLGRDGSAWIRTNLIQMAWRWVNNQPGSDLTKWFEQRTAGGSKLMRKIMIVGVARKLLIALWRLSQTGLVPSGAVLHRT